MMLRLYSLGICAETSGVNRAWGVLNFCQPGCGPLTDGNQHLQRWCEQLQTGCWAPY